MSTTFPRPTTFSSTLDSWIRFEGTAELLGEFINLTPAEDESLILRLYQSDVRMADNVIEVRLGASILNRNAIDSVDPQTESKASSFMMRRRCGGGTACIGNVEFCCESGEAVGSCMGYWRCKY